MCASEKSAPFEIFGWKNPFERGGSRPRRSPANQMIDAVSSLFHIEGFAAGQAKARETYFLTVGNHLRSDDGDADRPGLHGRSQANARHKAKLRQLLCHKARNIVHAPRS